MGEKKFVRGIVDIYIKDRNGNILWHLKKENLVVQTGLNLIASRVGAPWSHTLGPVIAVGTGTTTPTLDNTKLENEVWRVPATRQVSGNQVTYYGRLDTGMANDYTLTEVGVFENADPSVKDHGVLMNRLIFPGILKTPAIIIDFYISFIFG